VPPSVGNHRASLPRADPRYLTEELANDTARRRKTHVPDNVKFQGSKPNPGLRWIRSRRSRGGDGARRRAEGSRLWIRRRVPRRDLGHGLALCGRHAVDYSGWSKGNGTIAAQALEERARSQASRARRDAFQKVPAIPTWTRIAGVFNFTTCIEIDRFGPAPLINPVARFNRDTLVHFAANGSCPRFRGVRGIRRRRSPTGKSRPKRPLNRQSLSRSRLPWSPALTPFCSWIGPDGMSPRSWIKWGQVQCERRRGDRQRVEGGSPLR
jgi:hypothetical protein